MLEALREGVCEAAPGVEIVAELTSVEQGLAYRAAHAEPDLYLSDIELSDGRSFEIFRAGSPAPVIFCTAYDAYALEAFSAYGIGYVLKPYGAVELAVALDRYRALRGEARDAGAERRREASADTGRRLDALERALTAPALSPARILVAVGERILPVPHREVELVYLDGALLSLYRSDGQRYSVTGTLEAVAGRLGTDHFRLNRQTVIRRANVQEVRHHYARKLLVVPRIGPKAVRLTVSKAAAGEFLRWLEG